MRHITRCVLLIATISLLGGCSTVQTMPGTVAAPGDTAQVLFNNGWLFAKADVSGAEAPSFDDSSWRKVELPHDWSIEGPYDSKWASGTAFLPAGVAWYRKHFVLVPADEKTVTIRFDGVYKDSTVYLNGQKLGERPSGYTSFEYDLTPYLNASGDNVLAVRVDHHEFADSRWYPGSGIYRNVYLTTTGAIRVDWYGTFITTPQADRDSGTIDIETTLHNDSQVNASFDLTTHILDSASSEVAKITSSGSGIIKQTVIIPKPDLWSVDHPALYTALTEVVEDGKVVDTYRTPFGIRSIKFDANTGFWLNGETVKLKGVCLHEDAGALGSAIPRQVWERRLRILKEAGCNAIRCSHNPPAPEFLDLCDQLGFLVMDEAFDEWTEGKRKWIDQWNGTKFSFDGYSEFFEEWSDRDLADMILRDRNHPSIVMWSIGNEIDYPSDPYPGNWPELATIAARLVKDVKALDTSRPVTAACASIATNLYFPELDIVGYNYQEPRYAADHAANPQRVIYGSENKRTEAAWEAVKESPFISAQFLWTGIDYMGEAKAWPNHASVDGFIDMAGFPKDEYYAGHAMWNDKQSLRMADLFVPSGTANKIYLNEYKTLLGPGDGPNVAQVEVMLTNGAGLRVASATNDVAFTIDGAGRILAIESGDVNSTEDPHVGHRKAFGGRMIVYVETHGPVKVTAKASGLPDATVRVGE